MIMHVMRHAMMVVLALVSAARLSAAEAAVPPQIEATSATVRLESAGEQAFRLRTGVYTLSYDPQARTDKKGWIMIRRDGVADGLATKLANGQFLDVTDPSAGEGEIYGWRHLRKDARMFRALRSSETSTTIRIEIDSERQWARFTSTLEVYKTQPGLIHWRVRATALRDQAFSGEGKPDCFAVVGDTVGEWGVPAHDAVRYTTQRGPNAGIAYFRDLPMNSFVFYFEDLSSMNELYRQTRCAVPYDYPIEGNAGAVKFGKAESWFQLASADGNNVQPLKPFADKMMPFSMFGYERPREYRIPAGSELTFSDTYLYLKPAAQTDNATVCRGFVEMLADVYPHIYKPAMVATDWAGDVVPKLVRDVMREENTGLAQGKYKIPRAYVGYEHEDNQLWTVLNLLHPLERYVKQHPDQADAVELRNRLDACLPLYFDKEWGGFHNAIAPIAQDQYFTVVYIFSQAVMMADLAVLGNANARTMMLGYRDTLLRMGRSFNYQMADIWLRDFSKQKGHYQADATTCYIHVMMALYELSGGKDTACLDAAKAAADKLGERCMDLMWEANMTAAGIVGCERLYRATGDVRYRDMAYIPLANVLREAWLWECDYGLGEKTTNFWAFSGCPAAPCSAEFENSRTRLHFKEYTVEAADHLAGNVRAMLNDAWQRGPTQARSALPPLMIADGAGAYLPAEGKSQTNCGEIRYDQMIPLEDFRLGWGTDIEWWQNNAKPGVVGQEIYGAGGPIWYAVWQTEAETNDK